MNLDLNLDDVGAWRERHIADYIPEKKKRFKPRPRLKKKAGPPMKIQLFLLSYIQRYMQLHGVDLPLALYPR